VWFEVRCGLAGTHMHACMHKRKHARARARMRLLHPWATDTHFLDARQRQLVVLELQDRGAGVQVGHLRELLLPACLPRGEEGVGGSGGRVAAPSPSIGAALAWGLRACVLLSDLHAHSAPPLTRTPRSGPLPSLSSLAEPVGLASRGLNEGERLKSNCSSKLAAESDVPRYQATQGGRTRPKATASSPTRGPPLHNTPQTLRSHYAGRLKLLSALSRSR